MGTPTLGTHFEFYLYDRDGEACLVDLEITNVRLIQEILICRTPLGARVPVSFDEYWEATAASEKGE